MAKSIEELVEFQIKLFYLKNPDWLPIKSQPFLKSDKDKTIPEKDFSSIDNQTLK